MRYRLATAIALMICSTSPQACAHGYKVKAITVSHPWTKSVPEPPGADAIVSMELRNAGAPSDRLLRVETDVAASVTLRSPEGERELPDIPVPAKTTVELGPRRNHIRLQGLKRPLIAYDTLPITLIFEKSGRVRIDVLVEEIPAQ